MSTLLLLLALLSGHFSASPSHPHSGPRPADVQQGSDTGV
jgi:hypothetical protein